MLDCVVQIQRHCENTSVILSNVETPADTVGRFVTVLLIKTEIRIK